MLFVAPLLAAHLFAPGHVREVRAAGIVVRAAASETRGDTSARLEVRTHGRSQTIAIEHREVGAEMLLGSIEIVDANFDGHPDVVVLREAGAKWGRADVFLYEPHTGRFSNASPVARALSHLSNASFDVAHRVVTTRDLGPSNPSRVTYAIDAGALHETSSCRFLNEGDARVGTLVRTSSGHTTYRAVKLGALDLDPCGP